MRIMYGVIAIGSLSRDAFRYQGFYAGVGFKWDLLRWIPEHQDDFLAQLGDISHESVDLVSTNALLLPQ